MSVIGWIIAGARDLPLGGPLGALMERAARCLPRRTQWRALWRGGASRGADPRHSVPFTIAVISAFVTTLVPLTGDLHGPQRETRIVPDLPRTPL